MRLLFYILFISLTISCNGQEKYPPKEMKVSTDSALNIYQKQFHKFEFEGYKMFYNEKIVKVGTIAEAVKIFGKPNYDFSDDLIFTSPINITVSSEQKGTYGHALVEYKGKEYPLSDAEGKTIERNWDLYRTKGGEIARKRNKDGTLLGDVTTYRIWMSPYESTSSTLSKSDSLNTKIPALNGYIKINGKFIHQSITKKELVKQLQPLPVGGELVGMLGDPVLIYDLGDKAKDFDPNMDPNDTRVFIDIVFKIDPKTKEEKGIYYINYYYSLKDEN